LTEVSGLDGEPQGMTLRDYAQVVVRRLWLIALIVVVATGSAYFLSARQTRMYQATAKIMYAAPLNAANALTGQSAVDPYGQQDALQSVATAISNPVLQRRTAGLVAKQAPAPAPFALTAQVETTTNNTNNLLNTVVDINAASSVPKTAQVAANAYATAFIAWRKQIELGQINSALSALTAQMAAFKTDVAKQSTNYLLLVQSAQALAIRKATATGDFSVVVPAALPGAPYAPRPLRNAILGLAVGLFVAIGLAFVLEQFDTKLRSHREVAEILRLPVVGRVPRIEKKAIAADPLAVVHDASGAAAESLRLLRSNLDYLDVDGALSTVLVTSYMRGEGKSVTVCNLGVTLAMGGRRVVIIDADLRRPSVHRYMGLPNKVGLSSVVAGKVPLVEALQGYNLPPLDWSSNGGARSGNASGAAASAPVVGDAEKRRLYVLTSGPLPPNPGEIVASKRFEAVLAELKQAKVDFVLIDTPAFMSVSDAAAIAPHVDGVFMLVNMDGATSKPLLAEAREFLDQLPTRKLGVIVVREKAVRTDYYQSYHADPAKA
jgi:Mrp family chromosome partitioning ATPase/capsular polysaccharide biosynthesis protein